MVAVHLLALPLLAVGSELKPVDPHKPVYQMNWGTMPPGNMWFGGSWSQRKMKSTKEQIENAQYAADLQRGSNLIYFGIWTAVVSIVLLLATSSYHAVAGKFAKLFEWSIVAGGLMVIAGTWYKKAIEYDTAMALGGIAVAAVILSREKVRRWSVSHLFRTSKGEPEAQDPQIQESVMPDPSESAGDTHTTDLG